jgi:hypothetical protein
MERASCSIARVSWRTSHIREPGVLLIEGNVQGPGPRHRPVQEDTSYARLFGTSSGEDAPDSRLLSRSLTRHRRNLRQGTPPSQSARHDRRSECRLSMDEWMVRRSGWKHRRNQLTRRTGEFARREGRCAESFARVAASRHRWGGPSGQCARSAHECSRRSGECARNHSGCTSRIETCGRTPNG